MLSQPFLFTASKEERQQVRNLLKRFATHVAKEHNLEDKSCTSLVRKFVNRQSKPKMMTAYKQFMFDNSEDINSNTSNFTEFNKEKTRRWSEIKNDKDRLSEYERRANQFNEEHGLLRKRRKRPLTGYMLFSNEQRPLIKEKEPELMLSEVSKRIGRMWNELTTEEKDVWVKKSKDLASTETSNTTDEETEKQESKEKSSKKSSKSKKKGKKNKN